MAYKFTVKGIRRFNQMRVFEKFFREHRAGNGDSGIRVCYRDDDGVEIESYTIMIEDLSTQGFSVRYTMGSSIVIELPWLASEMDIRLCYDYMRTIKRVHRRARFLDEEDRGVQLTEDEVREEWRMRCVNMDDIIRGGERLVFVGVNRDFYLNPEKYIGHDETEGEIGDAFEDFANVQWTGLEAAGIEEEWRHVAGDEEQSSVRVVDNTGEVFIGACRYVGMMRDNACKMVSFADFRALMDGRKEFLLLDSAQALLGRMRDELWKELFDKAEGVVRENFHKTFIMRWNPDISNYKLSDFEEALEDFEDEGYCYCDWSIWDYQKVHVGDRFYMIRTGEGKDCVVMRGIIVGQPYPYEDWSNRGRKVYYVRMSVSHMFHPEKAPLLLTVEDLRKGIPDINWARGHSGEKLNDELASQLEMVWNSYVEKIY